MTRWERPVAYRGHRRGSGSVRRMLAIRQIAALTLIAAAGCSSADAPDGSAPQSTTPAVSGTPTAPATTPAPSATPSGPVTTAGPSVTTAAPSATPAAGQPVRLSLPEGDRFHWRIAMAPDGRTALVAASAGFFPTTRQSTIYEVTRGADGGWGDAVEVPFVGEATSDIDPFYSADGSRVWFSSIRPVKGEKRTDVDVWYVDRRADRSWGRPVNAGAVNSDADDLFPSIGKDGSLYVGSDRGGAGFDIWRAQPRAAGAWGRPAALPPPVSTSAWEFNPVVSPDGSVLVFTAINRDDGKGKGDLYVSRAESSGWGTPALVASVSTSSDEYHPAFSPDGETLYFVRDGELHETPVAGTELAG